MNKIVITIVALLLLVTTATAAEYGNILRRDGTAGIPSGGYPGGSTFTSANGRFQLRMQGDGYLTLSELTAYGAIKRWQYPADGNGKPGEKVILYTCYNGDCVGDKYDFQIGDFAAGKHIVYRQPGRAGWLTVGDDGNLLLYKEGGVLAWASNTTDAQVYGTPTYHAYAAQGRNIYFPRPLKDEHHTVYFSSGFISMRDQCTVSQNAAPVTFSALQYVEMLPGFATAVTGTGIVIIKPAPLTNTLARSAPEEQLPQPILSKFSVYPNPTNSDINVTLDPGDKLKLLTLFDNTGKQVASFKALLNLSIKHLPSGLYLYKAETEKTTCTGKIIKD